ncbi:unnamed protein product [Merluccius merluccius]
MTGFKGVSLKTTPTCFLLPAARNHTEETSPVQSCGAGDGGPLSGVVGQSGRRGDGPQHAAIILFLENLITTAAASVDSSAPVKHQQTRK